MSVRTTPPSAPSLLTAPAVARRVGVGVKTLMRLVDAGKFPAPVQAGPTARKRWRAAQVERWLQGEGVATA